jgi:hypothetical protein
MSRNGQTRYDRWMRRLKDHPIAALVAVIGVIVVATAGSLDALARLGAVLRDKPGLQAVDVRLLQDRDSVRSWVGEWFPHDTVDFAWGTVRRSQQVSDTDGADLTDSTVIQLKGSVNGFSLLDILVRNSASESAVLSRIEVQARRLAYDSSLMLACSPLAPSSAYHVLLSSAEEEQTVSHPVAHVVEGKGADRLGLIIGQEGYPVQASYRLAIGLLYDGNRRLNLPPIEAVLTSGCEAGPRLNNVYKIP